MAKEGLGLSVSDTLIGQSEGNEYGHTLIGMEYEEMLGPLLDTWTCDAGRCVWNTTAKCGSENHRERRPYRAGSCSWGQRTSTECTNTAWVSLDKGEARSHRGVGAMKALPPGT